MNRRALAAAIVVGLTLTGCAVTPTPPTYQRPAPVQQSPADARAADEAAFVADLRDGTVIPGLVATNAELRAATIAAGWSVCDVLDTATTPDEGMRAALVNAEQHLDDRTLFTDAMPSLFVASAAVHLCGVRA